MTHIVFADMPLEHPLDGMDAKDQPVNAHALILATAPKSPLLLFVVLLPPSAGV